MHRNRLITIIILTIGLVAAFSPSALAHSQTGKAQRHHARKHAKKCQHGSRKARRRCRRREHRYKAHPARLPVGGSTTPPGPNSSLAVNCTLYASPSGSDKNGNGSASAPFASVRHLDEALSPGQTGCLDSGTYGGIHTTNEIGVNGTPRGRITITSAPGQLATVKGWVDIEGAYTTVQNLDIDGSNNFYLHRSEAPSCRNNVSQPLTIGAHNDTLQYVDFYQSVPRLRGNGIGIGFWGNTNNTVVRFDKIHDVGQCDFYDHLIYLAGGHNARIYDNWLWNDAHGWGIKLDPGPQGAEVWGNVIDRVGSGFNFGNSSGSTPTADNKVFDNIVLNSVGVDNPDIQWSHPGVMVTTPGLMSRSLGNRVYDNVSYHNKGGTSEVADASSSQLTISGTRKVAPEFVNASAHDFALSGSDLPKMHGLIRR